MQRDSATLSDGTCGSFSGSWSNVTLSGGADTTVVSGNCYHYRYVVTDNVGNQTTTTQTADAKVDTTAPSAPSLTVSESSPLSYVSGTTLYYNAQGSNTASFTVDGTSTDAQSGIQKLNFPAVSGMTGGGDDSSCSVSGLLHLDELDKRVRHPDRHLVQRRQRNLDRDLHRHQGHHRADRQLRPHSPAVRGTRRCLFP